MALRDDHRSGGSEPPPYSLRRHPVLLGAGTLDDSREAGLLRGQAEDLPQEGFAIPGGRFAIRSRFGPDLGLDTLDPGFDMLDPSFEPARGDQDRAEEGQTDRDDRDRLLLQSDLRGRLTRRRVFLARAGGRVCSVRVRIRPRVSLQRLRPRAESDAGSRHELSAPGGAEALLDRHRLGDGPTEDAFDLPARRTGLSDGVGVERVRVDVGEVEPTVAAVGESDRDQTQATPSGAADAAIHATLERHLDFDVEDVSLQPPGHLVVAPSDRRRRRTAPRQARPVPAVPRSAVTES